MLWRLGPVWRGARPQGSGVLQGGRWRAVLPGAAVCGRGCCGWPCDQHPVCVPDNCRSPCVNRRDNSPLMPEHPVAGVPVLAMRVVLRDAVPVVASGWAAVEAAAVWCCAAVWLASRVWRAVRGMQAAARRIRWWHCPTSGRR